MTNGQDQNAETPADPALEQLAAAFAATLDCGPAATPDTQALLALQAHLLHEAFGHLIAMGFQGGAIDRAAIDAALGAQRQGVRSVVRLGKIHLCEKMSKSGLKDE